MNENERSVVGTNEELAEAQTEWEKQYYKQLSRILPSCAFAFGMTDSYMESARRIMIVGQQANNHTMDYATWNLNAFRAWSIRYLLKQTDKKAFGIECKKDSAPAVTKL